MIIDLYTKKVNVDDLREGDLVTFKLLLEKIPEGYFKQSLPTYLNPNKVTLKLKLYDLKQEKTGELNTIKISFILPNDIIYFYPHEIEILKVEHDT